MQLPLVIEAGAYAVLGEYRLEILEVAALLAGREHLIADEVGMGVRVVGEVMALTFIVSHIRFTLIGVPLFGIFVKFHRLDLIRLADRADGDTAELLAHHGRTSFIFLNRDGLPRVGGDYDRVFRGLRRKCAKSGYVELPEGMTPHTLRHTFCTEMAKAGMNPKALQYIMGHKDIKMTLGYYAHMDGCTAAEEMRRVAA